MPKSLGVILVVLAAFSLSTRGASAAAARTLTLDERVAAQRAIEEVYWRHRIWPKDNARPKPSLDAVMPESAIRAKVEDYLKKSNALEVWWRRPITGDQLQAELDRMARGSRDPRVLQELFGALGNDPVVIAETLARPALAERLARNWYANDERFHGATRREAERALARCHDTTCMKELGGRYIETTLKLRRDAGAADATVTNDAVLRLDDGEWKSQIRQLASAIGGSPERIATNRLGGLEESADAFAVTAVLSQKSGELVMATTSWPKQPFDTWWGGQREKLSSVLPVPTRRYDIRTLELAGCTNDTWSPTLTEVPDPRSRHSAVWTGTEMIVWGGSGDGYQLNTGGRYNPATDTWTPTSTGAGAPLATFGHTAVWTGTEMIVWGGQHSDALTGSFFRLNSGARYDPANDSWTPTSIGANVPTGREWHLAVWTGTKMLIWGGLTPDPQTGGSYDPITDSWTTISAGADAPFAYSDYPAVWTGVEMLIWGTPGGRYNPLSDSWAPMSTANAPSPRGSYAAVWTGTEMIVWGGSASGGQYLNTGGRYDPSLDSWTATSTGANVPSARAGHSVVWTGTKMVVWGGFGPGDGSIGAIYDPFSDSWLPIAATTLTPRYSPTAIWTGTEMVVWGGYIQPSGSFGFALNTGGRYNPTNDSWVPTSTNATVPLGRLSHTGIWTGAEMIVWGGQPRGTGPIAPGLNSGGRYTPATDSWVPTSLGTGVPDSRTVHSAVWTGSEMIVWGGLGADWCNTGGRYNPITNSWAATSTGAHVPPAIHRQSAVWTGHEMIVWGRGVTGDLGLLTGGRYDPVTDSWRAMAAGTSAPEGFGTPYVWTGHEMLVWGDGPEPGGRYNPSTDAWAEISTGANAPAFRAGYVNVWTGTEMIVWGGYTTTGGRYNPSTDTWLPTSTGANVPSPRSMASAVWTGSELLVWGGGNVNSNLPASVGGRYSPTTNSWLPISLRPNAPNPVPASLTASWTGTEMIVWGGDPGTATGGRYCACPSGRLVYRDADGDGYGDPGVSSASCDGSTPVGYVADYGDCNDADASAHPGGFEICDGFDDDCDGLVDESASGEDADGDSIHDLCDTCPSVSNATQSDFDHDGQGDACDLNDGLIYEWREDKTSVSWQAEQGPTSWNVYVGDLDVLKATGVYTQLPGSNALADRHCGELATVAGEASAPSPGKASYSLITGVTGGVEGSLGSATAGSRTNSNPCP